MIMNKLNLEKLSNYGDRVLGSSDSQCVLCLREVKDPKFFLHLHNDGQAVDCDLDVIGEDDSLGFYEVGSECRKKLPAGFVWQLDAEGHLVK
jgi:hypothetical protein